MFLTLLVTTGVLTAAAAYAVWLVPRPIRPPLRLADCCFWLAERCLWALALCIFAPPVLLQEAVERTYHWWTGRSIYHLDYARETTHDGR